MMLKQEFLRPTVKEENLLADFGGARIYAQGAAFVTDYIKNGYRSGKMSIT